MTDEGTTEQPKRMCPILIATDVRRLAVCWRNRCAWWDDDLHECSMVLISRNLEGLRDAIHNFM